MSLWRALESLDVECKPAVLPKVNDFPCAKHVPKAGKPSFALGMPWAVSGGANSWMQIARAMVGTMRVSREFSLP